MDKDYGEFQGTELDPDIDLDFEDEQNDLLPILGIAAVVAAAVGGLLVLLGRRRQPTPQERAQEVLEDLSKRGKVGAKTVAQAVESAKLGDLLNDAIDRTHKAARHADLGDVIENVRGRAEQLDKDMHVSSLLGDALDRVQKASSRFDAEDVAGDLRKQAKKARKAAQKATQEIVRSRSQRGVGLDTERMGDLVEFLKHRLAEAVELAQKEVAPRAAAVLGEVAPAAETVAKTVKEDVVPTAQDLAGRVREDVVPAAQERAGKLAEQLQVKQRTRKATDAARVGTGSLAEMLRGLALLAVERILNDLLPEARKAGEKAVHVAREEVMPSAAQRAGDAAQSVREDVLPKVSEAAQGAAHTVREELLPKVGEAAAEAPAVLTHVLGEARDKVEEALLRMKPHAEDAAEQAREAAKLAGARASEVAGAGRQKAKDVAGNLQDRRDGVGGTIATARHGVTGAVGGVVDATTYVTRESTGILFWLAMLGGLILLVFIPERDKQEEIWNNIRQFLGEVREMWRDLQGSDYEVDSLDSGQTSQ